MNESMHRLALRRERLVSRICRERRILSGEMQPLKLPCSAIDRGIGAAHFLKNHPAIIFAAATLITVLRPAKTFRWMKRGFFFFNLYKNVRRTLL